MCPNYFSESPIRIPLLDVRGNCEALLRRHTLTLVHNLMLYQKKN